MSKQRLITALGLAVLGVASWGTASAQCTNANLNAWTIPGNGQPTVLGLATLNVTSPGLGGSQCKISANINAGAQPQGATRARVQDQTPEGETRYRARFYVDASAFPANMLQTSRAKIWTLNAATNWAGGSNAIAHLRLQGSNPAGTKVLRAALFCNDTTTQGFNINLPNSGVEYYDIDVQVGNPGRLRVWQNATSEGSAPVGDVSCPNNNSGGATLTNLGLINPTIPFTQNHVGTVVHLDEFESRRQTFIGPVQ